MENSQNTPINDEFLLQCISNYKPLYDKSDKGYKSLLQRENCWASVARSVDCTVADAKARFKSLREKYRREIQIIEKLERSGAPSSARPVWPLMSFFKFLYKCGDEAKRPTTSNYPEETQVLQPEASEVSNAMFNDSEGESIIIQFEDERSDEDNELHLSEQVVNTSTTNSNLNTKKKALKKRVQETGHLKTELKQIDNVLVDVSAAINNLNNTKKINADRFDLFSQYLASELKSIGEPHSSILMEEMQMKIINYKRNLRSGNYSGN